MCALKYIIVILLILLAYVVHSNQIRIAATNALLNSLEFSKQNFEREVFVLD